MYHLILSLQNNNNTTLLYLVAENLVITTTTESSPRELPQRTSPKNFTPKEVIALYCLAGTK